MNPKHKNLDMKTIILSAAFTGLMFFTLSAEEIYIDSEITDVTVFLQKAEIYRNAGVRIPGGTHDVVFGHLASSIDPKSIQVKGKGNITILSISHRQNYLTEQNYPASIRQLRDSIEYYNDRLKRIDDKIRILQQEEQLLLKNQQFGGDEKNITVAELSAMADFFQQRMTHISEKKFTLEERKITIGERLEKLKQQLQDRTNFFRQNTSEIVINLRAESPAKVEFNINYVVNQAGWYPVYDIRAKDLNQPVTLAYKAEVFQNTGETWENVNLNLSTANPALGNSMPDLSAWYLDFYQPLTPRRRANARSKSAVATPEGITNEDIALSEAEGDIQTAAAYTNKVNRNLSTEFDISIPYTIPSGNKPQTVEVQSYDLSADYHYSAVPKLSETAFLQAKIGGWEYLDLLPGEMNIFFEGTYVGQSILDPQSFDDSLSVSLGRDPNILIERKKLKDFTSKNLIGSKIKEVYTYEIKVRNTKQSAIELIMKDQVPVSMHEDIEILPEDQGRAQFDPETGILKWKLNIPAASGETIKFSFSVKYPKGRKIPDF